VITGSFEWNGTTYPNAIKRVASVDICEVPEYRSARVTINVFPSASEMESALTVESAAVGPGTGLELFDAQPAAAAAEQIMKSVNPGWVDA
jgi:hypothetical protein